MSARILNGNKIRDEIYADLRGEIDTLRAAGIQPGLATVLVGDDPASKMYVSSKIAACEQLGLLGFSYTPAASISTDELLTLIAELNANNSVDGILVQLPLPNKLIPNLSLSPWIPQKTWMDSTP